MPNVSDFYLDRSTGKAYFEFDDGSNTTKDISSVLASQAQSGFDILDPSSRKAIGNSIGVYHVPSGAGDVEIMEAQSWIKSRFQTGVIELDGYGSYTFGDTVTLETGVVTLKGNRAIINAGGLTAGKTALFLTNTTHGQAGIDSGVGQYPTPAEVSDLYIKGNSTSGRDYDAKAIRVHTDANLSNVLVSLRNIKTENFGTSLSIGSRAYFLRGYNVNLSRSSYGLVQEAGVTDYSENIAFFGGTLGNSDCLIQLLSGQQLRMFGVSLDYFGDAFGSRVTANDRLLDIQAGGCLELYSCHLEFKYGHATGQTNSPIRLTGANSRLVMHGGFLGTLDTSQQPLWETPISTDNASQMVVMRDVRLNGIGRKNQPLKEDQLIGGTASNNTGIVAQTQIENLIPYTHVSSDIPSVTSFTPGPNLFRNGIDAPHTELNMRTSVTGTATISSTSTTDGAVSARNNTGGMLKITGQGKVNITIPSLNANRRAAWGLFLNTSQAVGTVTVKQRDCTAVWKWDGSGSLTSVQDTRNSYSSATKSITCGGTNQFERVSWKDVHSDAIWSIRMAGPVFSIEIDTTGMSSGAIYLDDIAWNLM